MKKKIFLFLLILLFFGLLMNNNISINNNPKDHKDSIRKLLTNDSVKYWDFVNWSYGWCFLDNDKMVIYKYNNKQREFAYEDDFLIDTCVYSIFNDSIITVFGHYKIINIDEDTLIIYAKDNQYMGVNPQKKLIKSLDQISKINN